MEFTIRAAQASDDAEGTADVLNPIIAAGRFTIMTNTVTPAGQRAWMESVGSRGVINVAVQADSGHILGVQSVEPISTSIDSVQHVGDISTFVALDVCRLGIGRALTEATVADATTLGFRKLLAMIREDNPDAVAFYTCQGFEVMGVLRQHVRVGERFVDEVIAERLLDE